MLRQRFQNRLKKTMPSLAIIGLTLLVSTPVVADDLSPSATISLVTSEVSTNRIACHGATIEWETNGDATSQVFYDVYSHENTDDYAYSTTEDLTLLTEHSARILGLRERTAYYYRVKSTTTDPDSVAISEEYTFTTPRCPASRGSSPPYTSNHYYLQVEQFGENELYRVSKSGELLQTVEIASDDERFVLTIPNGTLALDNRDRRLEYIEVEIHDDPPLLPPNCCFVGQAYHLGPDGTQFDPPIQITLAYDSNDLPDDIEDQDLVIGGCDGTNNEWLFLQSEVNAAYNTIVANIEHFTTFAILGVRTSTQPLEQPHIPDPVASQSQPSESGQLPEETAEGSTQPQTEPVTPPPVPDTTKPFDWVVLGPIIGVAVFAIVFFPMRLMRKRHRS
jgi:hypothetical protein